MVTVLQGGDRKVTIDGKDYVFPKGTAWHLHTTYANQVCVCAAPCRCSCRLRLRCAALR